MPAPANDDITTAEVLLVYPLTVNGTTVEATADTFEQGVWGASVRTVYYRWDNTLGSTVNVNLGFLTGDSPALDDLLLVFWLIPTVDFPADAQGLFDVAGGYGDLAIGAPTVTGPIPDGYTAVFQLHTNSGGEGAFLFDWWITPPNDQLANAEVVLGVGPATIPGTNLGATTDATEEGLFGSGVKTVWYAWFNSSGVVQDFFIDGPSAIGYRADFFVGSQAAWPPVDLAGALADGVSFAAYMNYGDAGLNIAVGNGEMVLAAVYGVSGEEDAFEVLGFSASGGGGGPPSGGGGGGGSTVQPTYQFELWDWMNDELISDISDYTQDPLGHYRLGRANQWNYQVPLSASAVSGLRALTTSLKVRRDGDLIAHCFNWRIDRNGERNRGMAQVTAMGPEMWWRRRIVRDDTGDFTIPQFTDPITGGQFLFQAVQNSIDWEGDSPPAPMGVTLGDDTTTVNLSTLMATFPLFIFELAILLGASGYCDTWVEPSEGTPGILGTLHAYHQQGSDLSGTVHFDYGMGDYSADDAVLVEDAENFANALWYFIGPKGWDGNPQHWRTNITKDDGGLPDPPQTALLAAILASRAAVGLWQDVRFYDANTNDFAGREAYRRLWQLEQILRLKAKETLTVTPISAGEFKPFRDYFIGDIVSQNVAGLGRDDLSVEQRLYGFDVQPADDGVERVSSLITSADTSV